MTIQVAPEDCTGCGICVETCPAHSKEEVKHKSINLEPKDGHLEVERERYELLPRDPGDRAGARRPRDREGIADAPAALRVLGRLRGLRRDAVPEAPHAALRGPHGGRQRDRLLLDLRGQPTDDAVGTRTPRARARPGRTRSSRTTPSSGSACGSRSTSRRPPRGARRRRRTRPRARAPRRGSVDGGRHHGAASACAELEARCRDLGTPEALRLLALAGALVRKTVWIVAGRLGVRHRLRRARPRARLRPERQRPRARHRGVLEHRRPGVEGDAPGRGREVRRRRQAHPRKKDLGMIA